MANNIENALRFYKHFRLVNGERIVKVMKLYDRLFLVNLLEDRKRISNYFLGEEMASLHEENIKLYRGVALLKREEYNVTENRWR